MNALNRMRRQDAARQVNGAATYRRLAGTMQLRPDDRAVFINEARKLVGWARADRCYAQAAGFKLP